MLILVRDLFEMFSKEGSGLFVFLLPVGTLSVLGFLLGWLELRPRCLKGDVFELIELFFFELGDGKCSGAFLRPLGSLKSLGSM